MAGSLSDYAAKKEMARVFGNTAWTIPTTYYIGLWASPLTDASTGSSAGEVSGGSYARVAVTNNTTNFPAPTTTALTSNGTTISFPPATGSWGTVTHVAILDASTGGNIIAWCDLGTSRSIDTGATEQFDPGDLTINWT